MSVAEAFAARTDLLRGIIDRLDRLQGRRANLIEEFAAIRNAIEIRHRKGELAASVISELSTYYNNIRKVDEEATKLLLEASQILSEGYSGG